MTTITTTVAIPATQPPRNAGPFCRASAENSMRMTAMMGTGLMAIPIANGRTSPMTWPIYPSESASLIGWLTS